MFIGMFFVAACGSDTPSPGNVDSSVSPFDSKPPVYDTSAPCTLGEPNTCSSCTDVCPGNDDKTTQRSCVNRVCGITCKGEYYDVDGKAVNGCEATDDLPVHDTQESAKDLGKIDDCDSSAGNLKAVIPSDERKHASAPEKRKTGRADFYKVVIEDTGSLTNPCSLTPWVRLDAVLLPLTMELELEVTFVCKDDGATSFNDKKTVLGGAAEEIELDVDCKSSDDSGTLTIEVRQKSTKVHSDKEYTLVYHG